MPIILTDLNGSGQLPTVKEFIADNPEEMGCWYLIERISESDRCYVIQTSHFVCFLWKKSNDEKIMLSTVKMLKQLKFENIGCLMVQISDLRKEMFLLGSDLEPRMEVQHLNRNGKSVYDFFISEQGDSVKISDFPPGPQNTHSDTAGNSDVIQVSPQTPVEAPSRHSKKGSKANTSDTP